MKTIKDLEKNYEIDFEKIINEITSKKCKLVLLQFADGLKPYATAILDFLEEKTKDVSFLIWLGDCFGACDVPVLGKDLCTAQCTTARVARTPKSLNVGAKIDLVIQIGHNELMPSYLAKCDSEGKLEKSERGDE